jgi:transmembrane sensor
MPNTPMTLNELLQDDSFIRWLLLDHPEDRAVWEQYLLNFPGQEPLVRQARRELALLTAGLSNLAREEGWRKLKTQIPELLNAIREAETTDLRPGAYMQGRARFRRRQRWIAAAAIIAVMTGAFWLYYSVIHKQNTQLAAAADVRPGGDKAVLTLSNGQHIILDSVANGLLASQGNTRVEKISGGQLSYKHAAPGKDVAGVLYNTLTTPRGGQYKLVLPDGTRVWVNAASSITYPTAFGGAERLVKLQGEAYFEVVHKAAQPFKVSVGEETIEDIGTAFDINAYTDEPFIATTLLEGKARVTAESSALTLQPGQQARYNAGGGQLKIYSNTDIEKTIAWKEGKFIFDRDQLPSIMRQLARWYDVKVEYSGRAPEGHFSGSISRSKNLSQVLNMLKATGNIQFSIDNKTILITP